MLVDYEKNKNKSVTILKEIQSRIKKEKLKVQMINTAPTIDFM